MALNARQLISTISSERALCGVSIGLIDSSTSDHCSRKAVLRAPEDCQLLGPSNECIADSRWFSSVKKVERVLKKGKQDGLGVGAELSAVLALPNGDVAAGGGLNANLERGMHLGNTQAELRMSKEACILEYQIIPMKSFKVSDANGRIHLSRQFLEEARGLKTLEQARDLLQTYKSHIYVGVFHAGGIMYRMVKIETKSETSLSVLIEAAKKEFGGSAGVSFANLLRVGVKASKLKGESSWNLLGRKSVEAAISARCECYGPYATNQKEFARRLREDPSSWHIIDYPRDKHVASDFLPVWEALKQRKDAVEYERPANLLERAWWNVAAQVKHKNDLLLQCMKRCQLREKHLVSRSHPSLPQRHSATRPDRVSESKNFSKQPIREKK